MAEDIRIFNNKNGYLEIDELVAMIHNNEIEEYMKNFKITKNKCIPKKLKNDNILCFHCEYCYVDALEQIKEYKNCYKVKGKKYLKEKLEGQVSMLNE